MEDDKNNVISLRKHAEIRIDAKRREAHGRRAVAAKNLLALLEKAEMKSAVDALGSAGYLGWVGDDVRNQIAKISSNLKYIIDTYGGFGGPTKK